MTSVPEIAMVTANRIATFNMNMQLRRNFKADSNRHQIRTDYMNTPEFKKYESYDFKSVIQALITYNDKSFELLKILIDYYIAIIYSHRCIYLIEYCDVYSKGESPYCGELQFIPYLKKCLDMELDTKYIQTLNRRIIYTIELMLRFIEEKYYLDEEKSILELLKVYVQKIKSKDIQYNYYGSKKFILLMKKLIKSLNSNNKKKIEADAVEFLGNIQINTISEFVMVQLYKKKKISYELSELLDFISESLVRIKGDYNTECEDYTKICTFLDATITAIENYRS